MKNILGYFIYLLGFMIVWGVNPWIPIGVSIMLIGWNEDIK